ncbi:TadE/TadG family type IV pilus assembly protein [Rhodalgimonas zhirmunskyi]|uniref:Pilus assembly protein n=1 Tax=Rhodalgimonas zhirmunskyi TaxID=2964767 RepID=A0AAJ1UB16_9RHOB|nr:TadE/TadG family type IV pilus assembly protein [Rhodoalgimonas zhirmunskyi]MDQ2093266.1 pilus assembly protein [Rhodoalgimonas zhirmunskyi]
MIENRTPQSVGHGGDDCAHNRVCDRVCDYTCDFGRARPGTSLRRFARDESGVMIAFSIFFFLIIVLMVGVGVDLMRFEMERTKLQNTLDRAVLAAADLQQMQDATDVVQDYFDKANLDAVLDTPIVNQGLNFREVTATARANVNTQFMHMSGVDTLAAPALASAREAVDALEIVLVLDISNSMNDNNRLTNLKPAARAFVDAVMAMSDSDEITISIVPYNTQVNAGAALLSHYNVSTEHSYSNCVNFTAADFANTALSTTALYDRTSHFDPFGNYTEAAHFPAQSDDLVTPVCPTGTSSEILLMGSNTTILHNKINALTADGNTSIDVGMKWANAILDPGTRPVINAMVADGDVAAVNAGKPASFSEPGVLKVIVVMTDGANTDQYELRDDLRDGLSDVLYNAAADRYSIWHAGRGEYFWPHDGSWQDHPYGDASSETGTAVRLTNPELFAFNSVARNAEKNYKPLYSANGQTTSQAWDDWYWGAFEALVPAAEKNTRLQSICSAAKSENVLIYSIGFEAEPSGETELRNCASSPSHFFDVDGLEISSAFQAIAASIAQLRLTQ